MRILSTSSSRILALVLAASVIEGCGGSVTGQARGAGAAANVIPITTATVRRISVQRQVDLSGTLVSFNQAKVSSEVAGRVRDVVVRLGTDVRAGDIVVELDSHELRLAADRAESALRQTEAQLGIDSSHQGAQLPADEQVASGAGSRASMAVTIIGGQTICLALTLLITPVMYSCFEDVSVWSRSGGFLRLLPDAWRRRPAARVTP